MGFRVQQPRLQCHELLPGYQSLTGQHLRLSPDVPMPTTIDPRVLSLPITPTPSCGYFSSSSLSLSSPSQPPTVAFGSCTALPGFTIADALQTIRQPTRVGASQVGASQVGASRVGASRVGVLRGPIASSSAELHKASADYTNTDDRASRHTHPNRMPLQELSNNINGSRSDQKKNKTSYTRTSRTLEVVAIYTEITDTVETYM